MKRFAIFGTAAVLTMTLLAGCATSPKEANVDENLDVYGAKQMTQEIERELAAFIPTENVTSAEQLQEGILMGCGEDGDRAFRWTGHNYVYLQGDPDTEPIVDAVAAEFSERPGYTTLRETIDGDIPSVHVQGPYGAGWLMALSGDRTYMEILSFSPCFHLAEDLDPRDEY
jgi:hypothetical protein